MQSQRTCPCVSWWTLTVSGGDKVFFANVDECVIAGLTKGYNFYDMFRFAYSPHDNLDRISSSLFKGTIVGIFLRDAE